jgi:tellurium resistance protein TerD
MTITLQKGQRISLSKEAPGLTQIICGLGWDVAEKSGGGFFGAFSGGQDFDLAISKTLFTLVIFNINLSQLLIKEII